MKSSMLKKPSLSLSQEAAAIAPSAKPARLLAECVSVTVSAGESNLSSCMPGMYPFLSLVIWSCSGLIFPSLLPIRI